MGAMLGVHYGRYSDDIICCASHVLEFQKNQVEILRDCDLPCFPTAPAPSPVTGGYRPEMREVLHEVGRRELRASRRPPKRRGESGFYLGKPYCSMATLASSVSHFS